LIQKDFSLLLRNDADFVSPLKSNSYATQTLFATKCDSQMTIWRACGQVLALEAA
jgi:hypothetical protein